MTQGRKVPVVQEDAIELQRQILCQEREKGGMRDRERVLSRSLRPKFVGGEHLDGRESCAYQEIHAGTNKSINPLERTAQTRPKRKKCGMVKDGTRAQVWELQMLLIPSCAASAIAMVLCCITGQRMRHQSN